MIEPEFMKSLALGDTFQLGTLFPALTATALVWELVEKTASGKYSCYLTYFGVFFGNYDISFKNEIMHLKEV